MSLSQITKRFINDERGVTAVEYAILGVAISAIILAAVANDSTLGTAISNAMTQISTNITSANTGG
ncbi:fimbrial protein [Enterovibrio norvegicus FF-33]|uniref:Fimbrial protein n=1 Tax=Enterovibrio norvegicus FF-454 TaxID=1185651 RepID=A0A1E5C5T9_9GAMM|nr:Flp family type IVb pilin [Enterovibrio norvegicus]OEE60843.1 fimbrial protein [Enterovibrio norvegicus FF-454]OEE67386.1 fimbrial protein [Enterovibrio norvegicus FF-33]OEE74542.1 fimbrial protein [Enterovibrio norvegicus FF-162]